MAESLIKEADETAWYENDQPIREFLDSNKKSATIKKDPEAEKSSWLKIVKKSTPQK